MGQCCCSESFRPKSLQSQFKDIYGDKTEPFLDSCITPNCPGKEKSRRAKLVQDIASTATVSDLAPPTYFDDPLLHVTRSLNIDHNHGANKNDPLLYLMEKYRDCGEMENAGGQQDDGNKNNSSGRKKSVSFASVASTASSSSSSSNFFQDYHKLVEIPKSSPLFHVISRSMSQTRVQDSTRKFHIKSIKRLENSHLWSRFALARFKMEQLIAVGIHPPCKAIPLPPASNSNNLASLLQQPHTLPLLNDDDDFASLSAAESERHEVKKGMSVLSFGDYFRDNLQLRTATVNEVMLFHGTKPHAVESICKNGLDCVKYASSGGCYGASNYFAENSSKSDTYCTTTASSDSCFMFLCRVLIGEFYEAHCTTYPFSFRAPCVLGHGSDDARKHQHKLPIGTLRDFPSCGIHRQADSVIGNKPREFVVYENDRIYPEYLIEFSRS